MRKGPTTQQPYTAPMEWLRADSVALAAFDPNTKQCTMNCSPHKDDPRKEPERKLLCGDCLPLHADPRGHTRWEDLGHLGKVVEGMQFEANSRRVFPYAKPTQGYIAGQDVKMGDAVTITAKGTAKPIVLSDDDIKGIQQAGDRMTHIAQKLWEANNSAAIEPSPSTSQVSNWVEVGAVPVALNPHSHESRLLARVYEQLASDSFAASFQTMGQYRTALLKLISGH